MKFPVFLTYLLVAVAPMLAGPPVETPEESDPDDASTRINPELQAPSSETSNVPASKYPFLNLSANQINMNGASWAALAEKFQEATDGTGTVSIVHIGDSHVQADGNTGKVRKLLQEEYGSAGRGLMVPFRLAGTNQPLDYRISSPTILNKSTLMRIPWLTTMGFTGVSLSPQLSEATFTITSPEPFNTLNIYGIDITDASAENAIWEPESFGGVLKLHAPTETLTVYVRGRECKIFGFDARKMAEDKAHPGILYHAIGNNGATFNSYTNIGNMGKSLNPLDPDLIIISLGTNEAFGRTSDETFYNSIDRLVSNIRTNNPEAQILLTTPSECQRSVFTRRKTGRRRRARRVRSYQVNTNVARMRDVILKYASDKKIPIYDFYKVAGGNGASTKWLQSKLLSGDRIHRTWAGYYLEGELLHSALTRALSTAGLSTPPRLDTNTSTITPPTYTPVKTTIKKVAKKQGKKGKRKSTRRKRRR